MRYLVAGLFLILIIKTRTENNLANLEESTKVVINQSIRC